MMKMRRSLIPVLGLCSALALLACDDKKEAGEASKTEEKASKAAAKPVHKYLPASCEVIGVFDIKANLDEPNLKKEVVPKLKKAYEDAKAKPDNKDMVDFLAKTKIDPFTDLHKVAICVNGISAQGEPKLSAALGGGMKPNTIIPALLASEDKAKFEKGKVAGLDTVTRDGVIMGQAGDGTLIVSNDKAAFEAAAKGDSKAAETAKLDVDKTFAIVAEGPPLAAAMGKGRGNPFAANMGKLKRIVSVSDVKTYKGETRVTMADEASAKAMGAQVQAMFDQMTKRPVPGMPQESLEALKKFKLEYEGADIVMKTDGDSDLVGNLMRNMSGQIDEMLK